MSDEKSKVEAVTGVGLSASDRLKLLSKEVAILEKNARINRACRCEELQANMCAHFGPDGKTRSGLFDPNEDLTSGVIYTIAALIKESDDEKE